MNKYLSFISDENLIRAVEKLHDTYLKTQKEMTLKQFYENKIDPIKILFDMEFLGHSIEDIVNLEIIRKNDKSISNAIGDFHETLLGSIKGFKKYPVGFGYDIKADDDSIYIDLKNKHNTVKGSNLPDLYNELVSYIESSSNIDAKAYYAQIIAKKSIHENWKIINKNLQHPKVYKISADQLYKLLTGVEDAFKQVCVVLPDVIRDYLREKPLNQKTENKIYQDLCESAEKNETSVIDELFNKTFDCYIGFPIEKEE